MLIKKACHDIWLRWSKQKVHTQEKRDVTFLLHLIKSLRKIAVNGYSQYTGLTDTDAKDVVDALLEQEMRRIEERKPASSQEFKRKRRI